MTDTRKINGSVLVRVLFTLNAHVKSLSVSPYIGTVPDTSTSSSRGMVPNFSPHVGTVSA